jgi:hypothetical protein
MSRTKHCPVCDADITDTYEPAEPDVGILSGGWHCDICDKSFEDHDNDDNHESPSP